MKKLIVGIIFVSAAFATSVYASERCEVQSSLATSIMGARQNGTPITQLIDIIESEGGSKTATILVKVAYKTPKYTSEAMKKEAATEFGNEVYLMCLEATGD